MQTPTPPHVEDLHLVYATDKGYLFISAVSAASAARLASAPERLVIHLLDCGLDDADWERFCTLVRKGDSRVTLRRHVIDTEGYKKLVGYRKSLAVYARMRVPDLLPDVQWCVYADGDTLFTDDPFKLIPLFDSTYAVLGWEVFDATRKEPCSQNTRRLLNWYAEHCPNFVLTHYICTGFLLLNLDAWRIQNIPTQCLDFIARHAPPWPVDLSTNFVCHTCKNVLPRHWGIFSEQISEVNEIPGLIHYVVDLPTRVKFRMRDGFRDVTAVYMVFAKYVLGLSTSDLAGIPRWKWLFGRAYNHLLRLIIAVLAHTPFGKRWPRMAEFQGLFIPGTVRRRLLSKKFWKRS